jgi:hypothetical protein
MTKPLALLALLAFSCLAQQPNWAGPYKPCLNNAELKKAGHMTIGVRYDIADRVVIQQFRRAFAFWAKLSDADFRDEQSTCCAVTIVDGTKAVPPHNTAIVARAQFPDRLNFQGWIAVDPRVGSYLADDEAIAIWIHEIGHLLGLKHNPSATSVMYCVDADQSSKLDSADFRALTLLHALRPIPVEQ